jgi:hypothetical protein
LSRFQQLIEQALMLPGESAIGFLLNSMRDAPPQKVRAERLWRFGPEKLSIATAQINDAHIGQLIQFGFDLGVGCRALVGSIGCYHEPAPDLAMR